MAVMRHEVFTVVEIEIIVFWVRHSVGGYERTGGFILFPSSQIWTQYQNCNNYKATCHTSGDHNIITVCS
jgi:hypothetical protein